MQYALAHCYYNTNRNWHSTLAKNDDVVYTFYNILFPFRQYFYYSLLLSKKKITHKEKRKEVHCIYCLLHLSNNRRKKLLCSRWLRALIKWLFDINDFLLSIILSVCYKLKCLSPTCLNVPDKLTTDKLNIAQHFVFNLCRLIWLSWFKINAYWVKSKSFLLMYRMNCL